MKYINIDFPFRDLGDGNYLKMNSTDKEAIKADLMYLLFTDKNQRYYLPNFGTNLNRYLFDMNDDVNSSDIKQEINNSIKAFLPNLDVVSIIVKPFNESKIVEITYIVNDGVFQYEDKIKVNL